MKHTKTFRYDYANDEFVEFAVSTSDPKGTEELAREFGEIIRPFMDRWTLRHIAKSG